MELTLTPQQKTLRRSYQRFKVDTPAPAVESDRKLEFFYIGKKTGNIDILISTFESGYAADTMDNARAMLKRLAEQSNTFPDIIIVEASMDIEGLSGFHKFLSATRGLRNTPFIVDASNIGMDELSRLSDFGFIDDIVFLKDYNKSRLITKVNFWKKVKRQAAMQAKPRVETRLPIFPVVSNSFKRVFDIAVSSSLLMALSPIFALIMIALRLESRGSVFYISKRAGRGYKIFDFYKFRTMVEGADQQIKEISHLNQYKTKDNVGPYFIKVKNDPRVTRLGAFLRKSSLDELPQLLNVLKGDMSLVGNRPLPLYEAATLTTDEWAKRFLAPAGITGLWQIKKRGKSRMSVEERMKLDLDYANHYNFLYDLWIMANTPSALIQKTNV